MTAAEGNGTAIMVLNGPKNRKWYSEINDKLLKKYGRLGAEQVGFLITDRGSAHFEMAGGEFCGNGSRAAGVVLGLLREKGDCNSAYTVSGFSGLINTRVKKLKSENTFFATSVFPKMKVDSFEEKIFDSQSASVVDLDGIIHVVIEGDLPNDYENYHKAVRDKLGLNGRKAVGVVFCQKTNSGVRIDPVVWVGGAGKKGTFYHEHSCGSGSIAAAKVTGRNDITQVTGKVISVSILDDFVSLSSEMEVVCYGDKS